MDWFSFFLGFIAFPLLALLALGAGLLIRKLRGRQTGYGDLSLAQRGSTLSFSSRLIGEIGSRLDSEAGPTAKAS